MTFGLPTSTWCFPLLCFSGVNRRLWAEFGTNGYLRTLSVANLPLSLFQLGREFCIFLHPLYQVTTLSEAFFCVIHYACCGIWIWWVAILGKCCFFPGGRTSLHHDLIATSPIVTGIFYQIMETSKSKKDQSITTPEIKNEEKQEETKLIRHEVNTSTDTNNGFTNHTHIMS